MKPLPAVCVRLAQHARDLDLKAVVLRRRGRCVDLEILRDRLNLRAKRGDESTVCRLYGEHDPRKQDHPKRGQLHSDSGSKSFLRRSSLTTFGSALPCVSFITWPTKKPSRPCLPPLKAATWPGLSARMRSTSGSSSEVSATRVSPRYVSALKSEAPLSASARMNASRGIVARAAMTLPNSAPLTVAGSTPLAENSFMSTFEAAFASTPFSATCSYRAASAAEPFRTSAS